jgi:Rad3-related DNA helicase
MLQQYLTSPNGILIGPSLLEGLDLKDDNSRFQIFFKMPFANISDTFVKKKAELDNGWYRWKSAIAILQGVGRSVRNENDWAKTYMLDGSFKEFIRDNVGFFPEEFLKRLVFVKDYS